MIEQLTTDTEFWRPIMPYIGAIIIAFCALVAAIFLAMRSWIANSVKKDTAQVAKEETYLALVNDLRTEVQEAKKEHTADRERIVTLQTKLDRLEADFLVVNQRDMEREKEFVQLTMERDALKKELERIAKELEGLRKEIQRLTDERDALNRRLEEERSLRHSAEVARIQSEADREKERALLNSEIATLQEKVAILEKSVGLLKEEEKPVDA